MRKILEFFRLVPRKPKHGTGVNPHRSWGNYNNAVGRVNNAGYRAKNDGKATFSLHKGDRKINGKWAVKSHWPEHNGAMVGGWYDSAKRRCYTVCNPDDFADYDDRVEQHEAAHDLEYSLRFAPPWHFPGWAKLFYNWHGIRPAATIPETVHGIVYDIVEGGE